MTNPTTPALVPGYFLVIYGEKGIGKSTLAQKMATNLGKFAVISNEQLENSINLLDVLKGKPSTLIIEAKSSFGSRELLTLKLLVANRSICIFDPTKNVGVIFPVPAVIICSNNIDQFIGNRRARFHHLVRNS